MRWLVPGCAALIVGCANGPQLNYASAPDSMEGLSGGFQYYGGETDAGDARALEQQESACANQGQHAVSQRVDGEMLYGCSAGD